MTEPLERRALDATERSFWGDMWAATPPALAAAHGVELRMFGPLQVTTIRDLPAAALEPDDLPAVAALFQRAMARIRPWRGSSSCSSACCCKDPWADPDRRRRGAPTGEACA
ncbi:MAG: hypothetical protein WBC33_05755, partial [Conexibacter sp.]